MSRALLFILISFLVSKHDASAQDSWLSKAYYGYHTHQSHELKFGKDGIFMEILNDRKNNILRGRYEVKGDTLTLHRVYERNGVKENYREHFLKYGYDAIVLMPWRYAYHNSIGRVLGEKQININYPQLPMDSPPKEELQKMIQVTINQLKIKSSYDSTLYIAPYFEINRNNGYHFERFNSAITFIEETNNQDSYLKIRTVGLGVENAVIIIEVQPYLKTFHTLFVTFKKKAGAWIMDPNHGY